MKCEVGVDWDSDIIKAIGLLAAVTTLIAAAWGIARWGFGYHVRITTSERKCAFCDGTGKQRRQMESYVLGTQITEPCQVCRGRGYLKD